MMRGPWFCASIIKLKAHAPLARNPRTPTNTSFAYKKTARNGLFLGGQEK